MARTKSGRKQVMRRGEVRTKKTLRKIAKQQKRKKRISGTAPWMESASGVKPNGFFRKGGGDLQNQVMGERKTSEDGSRKWSSNQPLHCIEY